MTDPKLSYCQHMVYLCDTQAKEWQMIADSLTALYFEGEDTKTQNPSSEGTKQKPASQTPPVDQPRQPPVEDPGRVIFRARLGHVIRGLILIFALGLPRMFYYFYAAYSALVLSGAMDRLQSIQLRQYMVGTRLSLDMQLARLRLRREALQQIKILEDMRQRGEAIDENELQKQRDIINQFIPRKSWIRRFIYQLPVMLIYSAFPWCHPHSEYLS